MAEEEIISTPETDEQDREQHDPPTDPSGEIERREPEHPGTAPIEEPPDMTDEERIPPEEPEVDDDAPVSKETVAASSEEPAGEAVPESASEDGKNWYIIHTYSGFEQKVADSLKGRAEAFGFADQIGQILIPTEEVMELRGGKKVTSKRLLYPGYVLVQMAMSDQLWHEVKNTPRVTGFVGGGNSPVPLSAEEVNNILYRQQTSAKTPRPKMTFEKNETVKIVDGPFANFSGKIDEINSDRNTLRVLVTIFGRATPVELDFLQVEKI
jgi:transcriptional antiterminator NusG